MSSITVYWDESHFWGLLVLRALKAWDIPHRIIRAKEIAQGGLAGKPPAALIVPGGRARAKAEALGEDGRKAVRDYVRSGGTYLGFCGGSGLGLTGPDGLNLCPWKRKKFSSRLQHLLSGHVHVSLPKHPLVPAALKGKALVPVWWPGMFEPADNNVHSIADYDRPGPDFWVADLSLGKLSGKILDDWENLYGVHIMPDFLSGHPCVITGEMGKGRYILSYPHLETPASPQANLWLGHILGHILGRGETTLPPIPAWDVAQRPVRWADPVLMEARQAMDEIIDTGREHMLLFWRTPWLLGWRRGIPGAGINSLYCLIVEALARDENEQAAAYWREHSENFREKINLFRKGVKGYLLAERLAMTVEVVSPGTLKEQRNSLFGPLPGIGGLFAELLGEMEELYWRLC